jgi:starch-binding outer membrane protein, SusD/RagB family
MFSKVSQTVFYSDIIFKRFYSVFMKSFTLKSFVLAGTLVLGLGACSDQELLNPSAASETQVVTDVNGLIALCNGIQQRYTVGRQSPIYTTISGSGLSTRELRVLNSGNVDEDLLGIGGASVNKNNSIVTQLWAQNNFVKYYADIVLQNLNTATDPAMRASIQAYASIFKALALGNLATYFEQVTLETGTRAAFVPRNQALDLAISTLTSAQTALGAQTIPAAFTSRIAPGINMANTINALLARYYLMRGNLTEAAASAGRVDRAVRSSFNYDDIARNPIFDVALGNINVFQPRDLSMGLPAALAPDNADARIDFYFTSRTIANNTFRGRGFFKINGDPIPVYLPDEMTLIRAEVAARNNQLTEAVTLINQVRTQAAAGDVWGVGANLPAYSGDLTQADILTEIYRQRCIELFMGGFKLEDSRRFGRAADRTRTFYPYPQVETDNNPNTPADPAN